MVLCPGCGEENPPKFRLCGYCGTALAAAPAALPVHEVRKTVTIIFCDLKGSTALGEHLDQEALHEVKERYFGAMAAEIQRHGGKVEKYIGDAIMAVFGLPKAHEDDALRAVRAAAGMNVALQRVNADLQARFGVSLANRTGVNTGEVVANDDPTADQKLATGDAVNVAARLEQAAPENEIYLGEVTYRLVRDAVKVEAVEALELKGKARRVPAYRLISADGLDGYVRRHDTPVVGRDEELAVLQGAWQSALQARALRLVTIVGEAGLGKSRLVREVIDRLAAEAQVLAGRCLPYGEGITFWPLRDMVTAAAAIRADDAPEAARDKLLACVGDADVADRLAAATGLSTQAFALHELYWGARRFFEILGARQPLVALVDDIHWAEPAFLDLLDHLQQSSTGAPVLLLATARPELLESRPDWGGEDGARRLVLRPLSDQASAQVASNLLGSAGLPPDVIRRIVGSAEGNPLYVEQMLSMLVDSGALRQEDGRWVRAEGYGEISVPPTIQALLEARLDRLDRRERAAVEPAAVIGLEFSQPAVESLAPEALRSAVAQHLGTLSNKQFIRPSTSASAELLYRFHHQLVRDTVYNGLLKRARATLHVNFVRWADRLNADRDRALEFEEILGYHLEQAHRYLGELGPLNEEGLAIGADAARRLAGAGQRCAERGDMHAAANLYRRAVSLLPQGDAGRTRLLPELADALLELGEFAAAQSVIDEAEAEAARQNDLQLGAAARLIRMQVRLYGAEPGDWGARALTLAHEVIDALKDRQAHNELMTAWRVAAMVHGAAGRYSLANEAVGHLMAHARSAGNQRRVARCAIPLSSSALLGTTPVAEAIAQCERMLAEGLEDRQARSSVTCTLAQLRAMNGEFDRARALYQEGRSALRELGQGVNAASTALDLGRIELLAGDLKGAEQEIRADYEFLSRIGETYFLSTLAALLARIMRELGRDDEAMAYSKAAEAATAEGDAEAQAMWRSVRAALMARLGDVDEALPLAEQAVALARQTEVPVLQAETLADLAAVLEAAGRRVDAQAALSEALALFEQKGDVVSASRARARRDALRPA